MEAGGVFFNWLAPPGPELTAMSQRKLTRQLRLWESPEGPPPAPSLTSPVSPVDQSRGHGGSALFRRMKLNRSIQERRRSSHCICRYSSASKPLIYNLTQSSLIAFLFKKKKEAAMICDCSDKHLCGCFRPKEYFRVNYSIRTQNNISQMD